MRGDKASSELFKTAVCVFLLFIIALGVFQYTVEIREPWFGNLSDGFHHWLTGSTLKYANNWYRDGVLNLRFGMFEQPSSIEFPTLRSRIPYESYPPGSIIPIFLLSKLSGHEATPSLVMGFNLLNHFLIALFLSLTVFFFLVQLQINKVYSFAFAIFPIAIELLLPGTLYFHQNVYFSDQAIILPFAIFVFLEVIRGNIKSRKALRLVGILQAAILFIGFLTDWLFFFVALAVYLKRIIGGEIKTNKGASNIIKESAKFWLPAAIAVSLFVLQLSTFGILAELVERFRFRAGINAEGTQGLYSFFGQFWLNRVAGIFGKTSLPLLWGSLAVMFGLSAYSAYRYLHKQEQIERLRKIIDIIGITLLPCFIQVYIFKNHSIMHGFSPLKFSISLAIIPFSILPVLLYVLLQDSSSKLATRLRASMGRHTANIVLPVLLIVSAMTLGLYLANTHPLHTAMFGPVNGNYRTIGEFVKQSTEFNHIVFSPDLEIPDKPPQLLSYSMKRVYKSSSLEDIRNKIEGIEGDFRVALIFLSPPDEAWQSLVRDATPGPINGIFSFVNADGQIVQGPLYYLTVDPEALK